MPSFKPFTGAQRSLVLAIDLGTTFSGIAYAVLDPGQIPKIQSVTRFPGQGNGDFKIPSIVCYTADGSVHAAGAEARSSDIDDDGGLMFVEWFKLYLAPQSMSPGGLSLPPLPPGKTVTMVIADFLAYLFRCAREYIQETHASGTSLWNSVQGRIEIVLSHPNGWEGAQQTRMREAAMLAQLVTNDNAGRAKLHFVTEGEASLHYCVNSGLAADAVRDGLSVMIVDCGGGTVDLTTYKFTTADPISVEETATPGCILQGSTRVNVRFLEFLQAKLANSDYGNAEDINAMLGQFERATKPTFKDPTVRAFIKFGGLRDKDPSVGIRNGQLAVEGADLEKVFQPSIDAIVDAIKTQKRTASSAVSVAFLVGGFAASPWLYARLRAILAGSGVELSRPDSHTNKAVSEGAVSFFLTQFVAARIARLTYGVHYSVAFSANKPDHVQRKSRVTLFASGRQMVPDAFQTFIAKGEKLTENREVRHAYYRESKDKSELDTFTSKITAYRGAQSRPLWVDTEPASFIPHCSVRVDTSRVHKGQLSGSQGPYFRIDYQIVLKVGLTELQAFCAWKENGVEKQSPAEVVFSD